MAFTSSKYQKVLCTFFLICLYFNASAHIRFEDLTLEEAITKANTENKSIFVDAYATWCAPCKIMDKVFQEKNVGDYFNENFINIKIDMEGPMGKYMLREYGVIWLPTLLVLDQNGMIVNKIDRLLTGNELISAVSNSFSNSSLQTELRNNPFASSVVDKTEDYDPQSKEEVIYIHDQRESSGRPHIMFHEAYLHLQLMDGKHQRVVNKYLSTQQDWSTEKNIKFIFDFLQDVNSKLFEYFISHRSRFAEVIGEEKVSNSLAHLINQRIEKGFPKVTLSEIIRLYTLQFDNNIEERAYKVYLGKILLDKQHLEYINIASEYLSKVNPHDHQVAYNLVSLRLSRSDFKNSIEEDLKLMQHAISLRDDHSDYYYNLAKLYYHKSDKNLAEQSISTSLNLATIQNKNIEKIKNLEQKILAL